MQRNAVTHYDPIHSIHEKINRFHQAARASEVTLPPELSTFLNMFDAVTDNKLFKEFINATLKYYNENHVSWSWSKSKESAELQKTLQDPLISIDKKCETITEYCINPKNKGRNLYKSIQQAEQELLSTADEFMVDFKLPPSSSNKFLA